MNRLVVEGDQLKQFLASILPDQSPPDMNLKGNIATPASPRDGQFFGESEEHDT